MKYRITETTKGLFNGALNCHILAEGDTVLAGDPNGGGCSAPDWDDMRRQLKANDLDLEWIDFDETSGLDEYIVVASDMNVEYYSGTCGCGAPAEGSQWIDPATHYPCRNEPICPDCFAVHRETEATQQWLETEVCTLVEGSLEFNMSRYGED
jgi:hypothetical protein